MSAIDAYVLIGNPNTRKGSVLRSLTGCYSRSVRDVQLQGERVPTRFYARAASLQDTGTDADSFVAEVAKARCQAVIFCLAASANNNARTPCPDAAHYVDALRALGWRIRAVAVLGQNSGGVKAPNLRQYPQAPTAPINLTVRDVRAQFGWV